LEDDLNQAYKVAKAMDSFLGVKGARKVLDQAKKIKMDATTTTTQNQDDSGPPSFSDSEQENGDDDNDNNEQGGSSIAHIKKKLDLLITYLRRVHMMCYYCGLECDSMEDLDRKCMEPHCRKSVDDTSSHATNEKGGKDKGIKRKMKKERC
jgi:hypothetical protein